MQENPTHTFPKDTLVEAQPWSMLKSPKGNQSFGCQPSHLLEASSAENRLGIVLSFSLSP